MGQMGWTASADAAPKLHVCKHERSGDPAAGYSIHPAAPNDYQQPCQVLDGVQGAKHCALGLLKCSPCCLGCGRPCPGGGGFPGLAEHLLVEEKSMPSQGFLPRGWFIRPVVRGERVTFAVVPARAACLASMEQLCPMEQRGEAAASPAVCNSIAQNEGHHWTESNMVCLGTHTARYIEQRPCAVKAIPWFLRGGAFCLFICQLPPCNCPVYEPVS